MSMNSNQINDALREMRLRVDELGNLENKDVRHVSDMLDTIPVLIRQGRHDKALRWFGFVQGAVWAFEWSTVEEMKTAGAARPYTVDDLEPGRLVLLTTEFPEVSFANTVAPLAIDMNNPDWYVEVDSQRYYLHETPGIMLAD